MRRRGHFNDLSKLHPELLLGTCESWTSGARAERSALIAHALRSLARRGDARALKILGYRETPQVAIQSVRYDPPRVEIGERVKLSFALHNPSPRPAVVRVDAAVQFVKVRGVASAKVFALGRVEIPAKGRVESEKSFSLAVHTTRKPHPGNHAVEVLVNGKAHPVGGFEVAAKTERRATHRGAPSSARR